MKDHHQFATLAVHAGEAPCKVTGAVDTPIYQSTTFAAVDSDEMAALYSGEKPGYMYTRYGNPTVHALEEKIAALEGGRGGAGLCHRHGGRLLLHPGLCEGRRPRGGGAFLVWRHL